MMNDIAAEKLDSSEMEILSEFAGVDEDGDGGAAAHRLGISGSEFIIASQDAIAAKPQGKQIPADADERTKSVFEKSIERDWWRGSVVFELRNFEAVLGRLEEIYGLREWRKVDLNSFDIVNGKDKLAIRMNSIMPHNVGKPVISLQIANTRRLNMDDLELSGWDLYVSPETGKKLMEEMRRVQPLVRAALTRA